MFKEFDIGRRLNHPGIVKTIYFLKLTEYDPSIKGNNNEFHIFQEFMEGGSLSAYLQDLPDRKLTNRMVCKHYVK